MVNLTFLETFVLVARLKSFTLAAERLNATQAAISSRVASLEAELGIKLFYREHRSLSLTPQGVEALARAEPILHAARIFVEELTGAGQIRGTLRIGVIDTISYTWLIDLIRTTKDIHPDLSLELTADTSLRLFELLRAGELDLALLMGPVLEPSYLSLELCTFACHWVASPALQFSARPVSMEELARHMVVSFPKNSQPHSHIFRFFQEGQATQPRFFAANSLATIIRMATDGIGVATIPPVVAPRELARGDLVLLQAEQPIPPMRFHAVWFDGPSRLVPATIAQLARQVALEFVRRSDPALAWDRASQT
jgi:DNA-binding transcriptional LysR family regulator